ncbi:hypothetical protein [Clostridium sp. ZS2-4]|uniref:hypothetical protein n=1 Tax=Clostridium sp. ZS2-4 TaxID=2987703 RepID=UPI00227C1016|nr:hypothetical protein [Clostridium sp. ZS2-4]MCY6354450.1 hypothetical protein [Clostridium sp. ZS2-4]
MKQSNITVKINKPENMDKLIERYSMAAAQIIAKKLPKHTLNNLIKANINFQFLL